MLRGELKFYLYLYPFSDGTNDRFFISGYLSSLQDVVYIGVCVRVRACLLIYRQEFLHVFPHCMYGFRVIFRTRSDYFPKQHY